MVQVQGPSPAVAVDEHVFLTGRPPLAEYLDFVAKHAPDGGAVELERLSDEWRAANDHIRHLEGAEAGLADSPPVAPLPLELAALEAQVAADPIFRRVFRLVPTRVGMVELDRLVVFQKQINLAYVRQIQDTLGPAPALDDIGRVCLPFDHPHPTVRVRRIAGNAYVFVSPSDDFRFLEAALFGAEQVTGYSPPGPVANVVGLVVGYGSNYLNVIRVEDRLVLTNGSHRAFALRDRGVTHVPCVIQEVSRREELAVVAAGDLAQNPDVYLKSARPPLLKDYFDPRLRQVVPVPRKARQVKISFGIESVDVPA